MLQGITLGLVSMVKNIRTAKLKKLKTNGDLKKKLMKDDDIDPIVNKKSIVLLPSAPLTTFQSLEVK